MLALCRHLRDEVRLGAVTNDIFTKEDGEFLIRHEALSPKGSALSKPEVVRMPPFARISRPIC